MLAFCQPITDLAFGLYCSFVGVVFSAVRPGLFTPWFHLLLWVEARGWAGKWIAAPLGLCAECFTGQLTLWSFLYFSGWQVSPDLILSTAFSILSAIVLTKLYSWTQQ